MVSVRTVARTVPTGITLDENLFNQATREMDFQETAERKWNESWEGGRNYRLRECEGVDVCSV